MKLNNFLYVLVFLSGIAHGEWFEKQKVTGSDTASQNKFGSSVAISGDYAVVGSSSAYYDGSVSTGAAYVFKKVGGTWVEEAILTDSNPNPSGDRCGFGAAVAIDGSCIIVGAPYDQNNKGKAIIYEKTGSTLACSPKTVPLKVRV